MIFFIGNNLENLCVFRPYWELSGMVDDGIIDYDGERLVEEFEGYE